jgi:hypothetical protein
MLSTTSIVQDDLLNTSTRQIYFAILKLWQEFIGEFVNPRIYYLCLSRIVHYQILKGIHFGQHDLLNEISSKIMFGDICSNLRRFQTISSICFKDMAITQDNPFQRFELFRVTILSINIHDELKLIAKFDHSGNALPSS